MFCIFRGDISISLATIEVLCRDRGDFEKDLVAVSAILGHLFRCGEN